METMQYKKQQYENNSAVWKECSMGTVQYGTSSMEMWRLVFCYLIRDDSVKETAEVREVLVYAAISLESGVVVAEAGY